MYILVEQAMCVFMCVHEIGVFSVRGSCEQWPVFVTVYEVLLIILILVSNLIITKEPQTYYLQLCASVSRIQGF